MKKLAIYLVPVLTVFACNSDKKIQSSSPSQVQSPSQIQSLEPISYIKGVAFKDIDTIYHKDGFGAGLDCTYQLEKDGKILEVKNCGEIKKYEGLGWNFKEKENETQSDLNCKWSIGSLCSSYVELFNLKPSKVSYVRDIKFDQDFLKFLPASILAAYADQLAFYLHDAAEKHTSYLSASKALEEEVPEFSTRGEGITFEGAYYFERLGAGDTNGDGFEDLVIHVVSNGGGSYAMPRTFTLSRLGATGFLEEVEKLDKQRNPKNCSGDTVDSLLDEYRKKFDGKASQEAADFLDAALVKCESSAPHLHMLRLFNEAASVHRILKTLDYKTCRTFLEKISGILKKDYLTFLPEKLEKEALVNKAECKYPGDFESAKRP